MHELVIPCMFKKKTKNNLTFFHLEINISCKSAIVMLLIAKGEIAVHTREIKLKKELKF